MLNKIENLNYSDSPNGDFLQSENWRKFQETVRRKTYCITRQGISASIIEHGLPLVGRYLYVPRGPVIPISNLPNYSNSPDKISNFKFQISNYFSDLINLAKENNAGWIRIDPMMEEILSEIKRNISYKIVKAPHDMQPKEILVIDITKPEEDLLAEMKQKTRYNIKLSEKRGVLVKVISNSPNSLISNQIPNYKSQVGHPEHISGSNPINKLDSSTLLGMADGYIDEFVKLVKITAERDGITPHPENYYRKMFEIIPNDILKLYIAEYQGKIIAANMIIIYGKTATYLHGASDNEHRNLMAPYLLQWRAIQDAKKAGCEKYDLGGVNTAISNNIQNSAGSWAGITRFKTGFAPETKPIVFPGSYDIVLKPCKYYLYLLLQTVKNIF